MSTELDKLAAKVAAEQEAIEGQSEDTRKGVIRMGKQLARMQKKEQAETDQTWKEWCEEQKGARGPFPECTNVRRYTLIAKYPGAYRKGMSIKEAYREAGRWKQNGGNPPEKEKVTISKGMEFIKVARAQRRAEDANQEVVDEVSYGSFQDVAKSMDDEPLNSEPRNPKF